MLTQDLSLGWIFGIGESRFHSGPGGQEKKQTTLSLSNRKAKINALKIFLFLFFVSVLPFSAFQSLDEAKLDVFQVVFVLLYRSLVPQWALRSSIFLVALNINIARPSRRIIKLFYECMSLATRRVSCFELVNTLTFHLSFTFFIIFLILTVLFLFAYLSLPFTI